MCIRDSDKTPVIKVVKDVIETNRQIKESMTRKELRDAVSSWPKERIWELIDQNVWYCFSFGLKVYEKVMQAFEYQDYVLKNKDHILVVLGDVIDAQMQKKMKTNPELVEYAEKLKQATEETESLIDQELMDNMETLCPESNVKALASFYKNYARVAEDIFLETVKNSVGFLPREHFLRLYKKEIDEKVFKAAQDKVIENRKALFELEGNVYASVMDVITNFLSENFIEKDYFHLFRITKMTQDSLFVLLMTLDLKDESIYADYVSFVMTVCFSNMQLTLSQQFMNELISSCQFMKDRMKNAGKIANWRKEYHARYNQIVRGEEHAHVMLTLFLSLSCVRYDKTLKKITCKRWDPTKRKILNALAFNLQPESFTCLNTGLINVFECLLEEILFQHFILAPEGIESLEQFAAQNIADTQRFGNLSLLALIREDDLKRCSEFLQQKTPNYLLVDPAKFKEAEILEPLKFRDDKFRFFFEKLSNLAHKSLEITICVSGFGSEEDRKKYSWGAVASANPFSEVICLEWESSSMKKIYDGFVDKIKSASSNPVVLAGALSTSWLGGLASLAATAYSMVNDNPYLQIYENAVNTGKLLARMLALENIFPYHQINIVGFSLGTAVAFECVCELERMGKFNIVKDLVLMGGVVNIVDARMQEWKTVSGRIVNVYCANDYTLAYLLKMTKMEDPIGLGRISDAGHPRVEDYDVTSFVNGHLDYRHKLSRILDAIDYHGIRKAFAQLDDDSQNMYILLIYASTILLDHWT
eukprot:TRINITY_DN16845_c0_g1_i1.p1 TRINITY_DN16845_c0_g1~~TRINITY_DN16845_c0_g1_i1.p1  ORF type:complete len:781 (-),score=213.88 TRINITY_DN16845_c0_g1_i1:126-2405(-)